MHTEVPVLRLGLAGFSEAQQKTAVDLARAAATPRAAWQVVPFAEADAWWLEGSRTLLMPTGMLRVQPGIPSGRSVQIALADVDRPVAFTLPLAAPGFQPAVTLDLAQRDSGVGALHQFAGWMQPMLAQFCLGCSVAEHQPTLAAGSWELLRGADLLAVVDLRLGAAVLPSATPDDFDGAIWCVREHGDVVIPTGFSRLSVSRLMWQYALRTQRDLLPAHYRAQPLYFRRPPRLAQGQMRDAHLLVLRELVAQPGLTFAQLQQATGLAEAPLARHLAALYVVGAITSNRKRALGGADVRSGRDSQPNSRASVFASELESSALTDVLLAGKIPDPTVPAGLRTERER